jgi:hypothetical protein
MNNTLSGKFEINIHNLKGCCNKYTKTPLIITKLKTQIIDQIVLPLLKNNWTFINNNFFILNKLKKKATEYYEKYKTEDLILYKNIIEMTEIVIHEHNQLFHLEKEKYADNENTSLLFKTKMIRLKAEYEIYHLLYKIPSKNELYDNSILSKIRILIQKDDITFDKIKQNLLES